MCDKGGFNVNFFTAGNYVYIGDDKNQVQCDVIEGACSVQCGGPNTLVCDTGEWTFEDSPRVSSGWLDVTVQIEVFANAGAGEMVTLVLQRHRLHVHRRSPIASFGSSVNWLVHRCSPCTVSLQNAS